MLEIILKGRIMMVPLIACSIMAIAVLIDRYLAFRKHQRIDTRSLRAKVLSLLEKGEIEEAANLCAQTPGPVPAVLLVGMQTIAKHRRHVDRKDALAVVVKEAMQDYSLHAMGAVEKRFGVLSTVGNAAPLLGMTGTVTGMINSFAQIADAGGIQIADVAVGISEALITTAAGLIIALVAVIPYNWFTARADEVNLEIEETTSELVDFLATRDLPA